MLPASAEALASEFLCLPKASAAEGFWRSKMKSIWIARILGVCAVSVLVAPSVSFSQTAINVPKSVTDFTSGEGEDACTTLNGSLEEGEKLTYTQFLNKDYCEKKLAALAAEEDADLEGKQGEVDSAGEALASAEEAFSDAKTAYDDALEAQRKAELELDALEAALDTAQADKDAKAAALSKAYNDVLADFYASDNIDLDSLDAYLEENADDPKVQAYLAAQEDFAEGRAAVIAAQAAVNSFKEEDLAAAEDDVATAATRLWGENGNLASPEDGSAAAELKAAMDAKDEADRVLAAVVGDLAELNAEADKALAANVAGTRNDDILASTDNNPAAAVLKASLCAASGDEESDACTASAAGSDVGQTIVDGFDGLHQKDKELDGRLTTEVTERKAADVVLQANIDKEVTERKAADVVLQANIDKEVTERKAADTVLQNNINTVNTRVTQLGERVDALTKESRQGIAMAMALAAIPTVNYGKFSLGVGVGTFASETAAAVGMDFVVSERVKFKVGFTTTGDESGGSAGFAIGF